MRIFNNTITIQKYVISSNHFSPIKIRNYQVGKLIDYYQVNLDNKKFQTDRKQLPYFPVTERVQRWNQFPVFCIEKVDRNPGIDDNGYSRHHSSQCKQVTGYHKLHDNYGY
jgi:hypothetical protein